MTGKPCTTKIKYATMDDALVVVIRHIYCKKEQYGNRAYKCGHCHHWHLTSQPRRNRFQLARSTQKQLKIGSYRDRTKD